jgi:hypothetical protein
MTLTLKHAVVGVLGLTSIAAAASSDDVRPLSAQGILRQIVGHTIRYQNDAADEVEEFFAADGSIHGWSRKQGTYRSDWQIRFGHYLCIVSAAPLESGCVRAVVLPGGKVEFRLDIGEREGPFDLLQGNPRHLQ